MHRHARRSAQPFGAMNFVQSLVRPSALLVAFAFSGSTAAASAESEAVESVDICAVLSDPLAYNGKLLRITGSITRDFETFWIESAECSDVQPLWIEYGGSKPADGPIWHEGPEHPGDDSAPLLVDGIRTSVEADAAFRKFDALTKSLKRGKRARATIVGWIFAAATYQDEAGKTQETGFGPYGRYSLLVIKKVDAVSRR
jgi:hypothetical protein